jgi:hypothetical protein
MKSVMQYGFKFKINGLAKEGACRKPGMGHPECSPSSRAGPTGIRGWTRPGPAASEPRRRATRREVESNEMQ